MEKLSYFLILTLLTSACVVSKTKYQTMQMDYQDSLRLASKKYKKTQSAYQDSLIRSRVRLEKLYEKYVQMDKELKLFRTYNNMSSEELTKQIFQYKDSLKLVQKQDSLLKKDFVQKTDKLVQDKASLTYQNRKFNEKVGKLEKSNQRYKYDKEKLARYIQNHRKIIQSYSQIEANKAGQLKNFTYYIVDLEKSDLELFWKNDKGKKLYNFSNLTEDLMKKDKILVFATNAGMYTPEHAPQGLYVEKGKMLRSIDLKKGDYAKDGNFYMSPNGIFLIDKQNKAHVITSDKFKDFKDKTLYATQSGPMLVIDSLIHKTFRQGSRNRKTRSGVGVRKDGKLVFVISQTPVNFYDFAILFRDTFKCPNALYLDGTISKMYLPSANQFDLGGKFGAMIGVYKSIK